MRSNKFFKSFLSVGLVAAMVLGTAGCGKTETNNGGAAANEAGKPAASVEANNNESSQAATLEEGPYGMKYAKEQVLHTVYNQEASHLKTYGGESSATAWAALSYCVAGLITADVYGDYAPSMAKAYTVSDDGLVYTFTLRDDLKWADYKGNDKGQITTKDFMTSFEYMCDPANGVIGTDNFNRILNFQALVAGEETDFSKLGVKALDDYTLEITLAEPCPYFLDYCGSIMPLPTEFFKENMEEYGLDNETIYYSGAYIMTEFDPDNHRTYVKNDLYFDAANVYIERIEAKCNKEANALAPEMFKRGDVDYADLSTDILDEWRKDAATADIVVPGKPDLTYMYYYSFCYDPQFDEKYDLDSYKLAIANENFRQSLYWGLDRVKAYMTQDPYNYEQFLTNSITGRTWCNIDGTDFVDLAPMKEVTARANHGFDEKKAVEYKEKAVAELTAAGAKFPIKLLMPYNPNTNAWDKEIQVVKQQLEALLGSDYIECVIETGPSDGFLSAVRRSGKYGFMRLNNGGAEKDPHAWTRAFRDEDANSWTFMQKVRDNFPGTELDKQVSEYFALLEKAESITVKSKERYEAFAEAEAYLIEHALVIPYCTDSAGYHVTRYNPFELSTNRKILESPLTVEQYQSLYADWLAESAKPHNNFK